MTSSSQLLQFASGVFRACKMDSQIHPTAFLQSSRSPVLSQRDTQILNQLLSPGFIPPLTNIIDLNRPNPPSFLLALEASILAPLNIQRPSSATLRTAIDALSALIAKHPDYASAYNNRAQAMRLLLGDDLRTNEGVWVDLSEAIALVGGAEKSTFNIAQARVSKHEASVLSKAYSQRAWLLWKLAKASPEKISPASSPKGGLRQETEDVLAEESLSKPSILPDELRGLSREDLEEMASRDFTMGGMYGDEGARGMAVRTSPYAKLCGEIVKEAMKGDMLSDSHGVQ